MVRKVRISTISMYLPDGITKLEENVDRAFDAINEALTYHPDIICLPEDYTVFCSSKEDIVKSIDMADEINNKIQQLAIKGKCYIISTILTRRKEGVYNSAFIIDRKGEIIGKYDKTHLAPKEHNLYGNIPGNNFPVFETDFGKIAVMICMDIHYVEVARIYGVKGVEILFWPTQTYDPSEDFIITLLRSRAMDNQMYVVASNFCKVPYYPGKEFGRACIVGLDGKILADTGNRPAIATTDIDLDEQMRLDWSFTGEQSEALTKQFPDLKTVTYRTRRPNLYKILGEEIHEKR